MMRLSGYFDLLALIGIGALLIPFIFTSSTIDPVLMPRFLALALTTLLLTLLLILRRRQRKSPLDFGVLRRAIFIAAMFYWLVSALSLTQAINVGESLVELLKIGLAIAFLALATLILGGSPNGIVVLTRATTVAAAAVSIIGICQYYFIAFNSIPGNFLVYATMANKNLFASFLFLALPFVLYGFLQFAGYWRMTSALALALVTFCVVIVQTRAVWLAIAASTLAVILFLVLFFSKLNFSNESRVFYRRRLLQTALLVGIVALTASFSHSRQVAADSHVEHTFSRRVSSIDERITLWNKTLQMAGDHPILGVGLDNWKIMLPNYGMDGMRSELGVVHFQRPHNDFLWVLAETGPLGLAGYLSIFVIAIIYVAKICRQVCHGDEKIFSLFMLFGIIGYLAIACFDFPKERIEHTVYVMLILAAVISIYHRAHPLSKPVRGAAIFLLFAPSIILSVLAMAVGCLRINAEIHAKKALAAREAQDWPRLIYEINQAESWFATLDPMATPLPWYRGVAHFSLNRMDDAFRDFQHAYKIHPYHIHVLNNLATCYELRGDHNKAVEYYSKALAISPRFEEALINLSAVYFNLKEYDKAHQTLSLCDPNSKNPKLPAYREAITSKLTRKDSL